MNFCACTIFLLFQANWRDALSWRPVQTCAASFQVSMTEHRDMEQKTDYTAPTDKTRRKRGNSLSALHGALPSWPGWIAAGQSWSVGVWGWGCVRSTLRLCSQPFSIVFATVRSRSQPSEWGPYGRAYGKFCRRGHFGGFKCRVASFRGRRGTSWHLDVFRNVSKVVLCGTRNTFATFSQDKLQFSWQAQRFGRVQLHLAWQAQHFRSVVLRVFCESHCQGCVKWRQGANSVAGVAVCEMWWKLTEALHETSILK